MEYMPDDPLIQSIMGMHCGEEGSDYISHHGIKGQKWGVRRFQNRDGSLTSAGKARAEKLRNAASGAADSIRKGTKKAAASVTSAAKTTKARYDEHKAKKEQKAAEKAAAKNKKYERTAKEDLSQYSDAQLQAKINRINNENKYRQLTTPTRSAGKEAIDKFKGRLLTDGQDVLNTAIKNAANKALDKVVNKMFAEVDPDYNILRTKPIQELTDKQLKTLKDRLNAENNLATEADKQKKASEPKTFDYDELSKKDVEKMSNAEIKALTDRLNAEDKLAKAKAKAAKDEEPKPDEASNNEGLNSVQDMTDAASNPDKKKRKGVLNSAYAGVKRAYKRN